jgi:hypothetical protein
MYYLQISSNIMSLGGLARAIGVLDNPISRFFQAIYLPVIRSSRLDDRSQCDFLAAHNSAVVQDRQPIHAPAL